MSDGRTGTLDRTYIPHAVAWVNAWNEVWDRRFIPDFLPSEDGTLYSRESIDSAVKRALHKKEIFSSFPNPREINIFCDEPSTLWVPLADMNDYATRFGLTVPVMDDANPGYRIIASELVLIRSFSRDEKAQNLRRPYISLVNQVYEDIQERSKILRV